MSTQEKDTQKPRYVDAEILYENEKVEIGGVGSGETVMISQLVRKGDYLAGFPNYAKIKKKGYLKSPIEPGNNVEFSEDGNFLQATISGYPKTRYTTQDEGPDILVVSILPVIKVAHDKMQASINIHPPIKDSQRLSESNVDEIIEESGVVYGIDNYTVKKVKSILSGPITDIEDILFASGTLPGEGEDARVEYDLEIGPLAGQKLDDGSIDFRDRKVMVGVSEGDKIATKIPAIPGQPGYNVFGHEIEPKTGKDVKVKVQGNARFIPEENIVVATSEGALSVVNASTIKVVKRNIIHGDVDYKTGNIESGGHVIIRGTVLPGFKVDVGGDLQIIAGVSGGNVICGGNTVIKGGITGKNSIVQSDGDVDLVFIERGVIKSGGLIVIRKQSYYSSVEADQDIRCHKDSTIIGGSVFSGRNLTVGTVGSEDSTPATLAAGVDPKRYQLYLDLKKQYLEQQEEIIQRLQMLGSGSRPKKIRQMEEAADEVKQKMMKLNLIPGTELYSRIGKGKERDEMDDEDPMYMQGVDISKIRVEVVGKIWSGTKILIGNRHISLKQDAEKRRFRLSKNLKRIMAIPLS